MFPITEQGKSLGNLLLARISAPQKSAVGGRRDQRERRCCRIPSKLPRRKKKKKWEGEGAASGMFEHVVGVGKGKIKDPPTRTAREAHGDRVPVLLSLFPQLGLERGGRDFGQRRRRIHSYILSPPAPPSISPAP